MAPLRRRRRRVPLPPERDGGATELFATTRVACGRQPFRHLRGAPRQVRARLARSYGAGPGDAAASVNYCFISTPSTRVLTKIYTGAHFSASCTGGPKTPHRARPAATTGAATTAARSWHLRSRPRISDTSRGPKLRHAGMLRRRTRRQSRRRRTAPRRRSGTRGGSATTAPASRRRRRACREGKTIHQVSTPRRPAKKSASRRVKCLSQVQQ